MSNSLENAPASRLEIITLGEFKVLLDGKPLETLTSRPAQALLVYLAAQGRPVSRRTLAAMLWSERAESNALGNLRVTLHRLGSLLGALLDVRRTVVALDHLRVSLDVDVLESCLSDDRLEQAVALYRGVFLAGFYLRESRAFEDWQAEQADCLRGEMISACQRLVRSNTEVREYEKAISYARRLLEMDPFHEPAQRQLLRLLALTSQRAAALAGFERFRKLLREQVGTEPDPASLELYAQVKAGLIQPESAPVQPKAPAQAISRAAEPRLPQPTSALVGRQEELAYLLDQLANPDCRLLTLLGPGGIGKTRLAIEAAHALNKRFPNGVFFSALAGALDQETFLLQLSQSVGFDPLPAGDLFQQMLEFFQHKAMLVVLDNFEQLLRIPEAAWAPGEQSPTRMVSQLLRASPALKILVTSRERLRLEEEWLLPLRGLGMVSEAAAFFAQVARRLQPGFDLAENLGEVNEICRLTGGTPLALEMAASWIQLMTCRQIAERIRENLDFLSNRGAVAPERQRSVRALFEYSWHNLSLEEKRLFCWLSVFRRGGHLEEVLAVSGMDPSLLLHLAEKSLIQVDGSGCYGLHELMRQYAGERLQEAGEKPEAARRHFEVYLALAETADRHLRRLGQEAWLDRLEAERENLAAAFEWAFDQQPDPHLPVQLALALGWFWRIRSHAWEARHWLDRAARLEGLRSEQRAGILSFSGMMAWMQGNFHTARHHLEESRLLWANTQDRLGLAYSIHSLGMVHYQLDEVAAARDDFLRSLELFTQQGDEWGRAFSLGWLGKSCDRLGETDLAESASQECISNFRQLGDRFGLALFLGNETWRLLEKGDLEKARCLAEETVALRREIGHQHSLADALSMLGEIAARNGELPQAREYYRQAQGIYANLGNQSYAAALEGVIQGLKV